MKKLFTITLFIFTIINFIDVYAQNILVQLQQPPMYQFHVEDMWKVTITNTSQNPIRVYLYGVASIVKEGKIVDATTKDFNLNPGV